MASWLAPALVGALALGAVMPLTASAAKISHGSAVNLPKGGGGTQGKKVGVTVQSEMTLSASTQVSQFREAIAEHPAAIAIEILSDAAVTPAIREAYAAGVPVIVFDGPTEPSDARYVRTVLSNNPQLGTIAAENLVQGLKSIGVKSGDYAVLAGLESMLITSQRLKAFFTYMKKYPQYKDVQTMDTQWSSEIATTDAASLFAKYGGNLKAVYGMADYLAVPAIQAAQNAGLKPGKNVIISGGNCFKIGIQAVKAGTYFGTATEDPGTVAMQTAAYITKFLDGKNPPQHEVITEHRITKSNVAQYAAECSHA
jgi:ABC-type sugar transport system substrate-binding protein